MGDSVSRRNRGNGQTGRRASLAGEDFATLKDIRDFIQEQIDSGGDTCGEHRLQVQLLDRLIGER